MTGPFLAHFAAVKPEHLISLSLYTAVIVYSGALAAVCLLLHCKTRVLAAEPA